MSTASKRAYLKVLAGVGTFMRHIKMFRAALAAFVTVVLTSQSLAVDIFVSPTGSGEKTGLNWSNALNGSNDGWHIDIKNAITSAIDGGAEEVNVYLAAGDYSITNELALSSITIPVKFSGGYVGEADGDLTKSETDTELLRITYKVRHINANTVMKLSIKGIIFRNGSLGNTTKQRGGSLHLKACNTEIENCKFLTNTSYSKSQTSSYGGAIFAEGGSIVVSQCVFTGNVAKGGFSTVYGGAMCTLNADLIVEGCTFSDNYITSSQNALVGGAIAANGKTVIIRNSTFSKNYVYSSQKGKGSSREVGGSIAVRSALRFEMSDCVLENNLAYLGNSTSTKSGFYIDDVNSIDGMMTSVVTRCVFNSASLGKSYGNSKSDILLNGGCLFMTNCVIIGSLTATDATMTNAIRVARVVDSKFPALTTSSYTPIEISKMELVNCTIADGKGAGAVRIGTDCDMVLKNCIVSGNTAAGVINATSIEHSYIQKNVDDGSWNYEGTEKGNLNPNVVGDINWTGAPYYHLLTKKADGAITNGWFSGTFKSPKTAADSPCIDAGAPGSLGLNLEPDPHGRRVNIGAYGGTPWASKTSLLPGFKLIIR